MAKVKAALPAAWTAGSLLTEKATMVAQVMDAIDHCTDEELPAGLQRAFTDAVVDLKTKVDLAYMVFDSLKSEIEQAQSIAAAFTAKAKRIQDAIDRMKSSAQSILEAQPDLKLEGEVGRIRLQANAWGLHLNFPTKPKTIYGAMDERDIFEYEVPNDFLKKHVTYSLDSEKVRQHLEAGNQLTWARLERGHHVRIEAKARKKGTSDV